MAKFFSFKDFATFAIPIFSPFSIPIFSPSPKAVEAVKVFRNQAIFVILETKNQ